MPPSPPPQIRRCNQPSLQPRRRRWRIVYNSMQAKAKPEAQLGDSEAGSMSLGGRAWQIPTKSPPNPSSIHQVASIQSVGSVGSVGSIASNHPTKRNIPYWYCPLCTPSLTLPPSSLKCLQKSNPGIHIKCFHPTEYYKKNRHLFFSWGGIWNRCLL